MPGDVLERLSDFIAFLQAALDVGELSFECFVNSEFGVPLAVHNDFILTHDGQYPPALGLVHRLRGRSRMRRHFVRVLAVTVGLSMVLVACGDDTVSTTNTTNTTAGTPATTQITPATTAPTTTTAAATTAAAAPPGEYGSIASLDGLWDRCATFDWAACDELYFRSPIFSAYEEFGETCGLRIDGLFGFDVCEAFFASEGVLALDPFGVGVASFGRDPVAVELLVTEVLGSPETVSGWGPHPIFDGYEYNFMQWGESLFLYFGTNFTGYALDGVPHFQGFEYFGSPPGLTTAEGIGVGNTVASLRQAYGSQVELVFDLIAGLPVYQLNPSGTDLYLCFQIESDSDSAAIFGITGGNECSFSGD
ncbi:MAG: hypothetical protein V3S26_08855 [Acidimicrobiia bacterium]